jgi:excisionase family DNA binding protein
MKPYEMLEMNFTSAHSLASKLLARKSLMAPNEVAEILSISRLTVLRWAKKGVLPSVRMRNKVMFDPGNIARWLVSHGVRSDSVKPLPR